LEGEAVAASYIVERILAEFAAASVVLAKSVEGPFGGPDRHGEVGISFGKFSSKIRRILENFCPDVIPFFSTRAKDGHQDFFWTGERIEIFPRSEDIMSVLQVTRAGELMDFPKHPIYAPDLDKADPIPVTAKQVHFGDAMAGNPKGPNSRLIWRDLSFSQSFTSLICGCFFTSVIGNGANLWHNHSLFFFGPDQHAIIFFDIFLTNYLAIGVF